MRWSAVMGAGILLVPFGAAGQAYQPPSLGTFTITPVEFDAGVPEGGPETAPDAAIDAAGCSVAQFCGAIDVSTGQGVMACRRSDWRNDEPVGNPKDCTVDPAADLCVPAAGTLPSGRGLSR